MPEQLSLLTLDLHKVCSVCGIDKPGSQFNYRVGRYRTKGILNLRSECCECEKIEAKKRSVSKNAIRFKDPEEYRRRRAEYRKKNKAKIKKYNKENGHRWVHNRYKKEYNITYNDKLEMFRRQEGKCIICDCVMCMNVGSGSSCMVDHDHITGKIRGLLCHNCNTMLGHAKDSDKILYKAILYLKMQ